MRSQIIHIPTGLYLNYCYYPAGNEIHIILSDNPAPWFRNNLDVFDHVSKPSWDKYIIYNGDNVFEGTCDEFVLLEQRI